MDWKTQDSENVNSFLIGLYVECNFYWNPSKFFADMGSQWALRSISADAARERTLLPGLLLEVGGGVGAVGSGWLCCGWRVGRPWPGSPSTAGWRAGGHQVWVTLCYWVEGHEMPGFLVLPGWAEGLHAAGGCGVWGLGWAHPQDLCQDAAADRHSPSLLLGVVPTRLPLSRSWVGWFVLLLCLSVVWGGRPLRNPVQDIWVVKRKPR